MLSIIFELIERFDIDGIELDFMRHPAFFRVEEAFAQRYLATDLVRQVRSKLDDEGRKKDRELSLAIRVPPTLRDCVRIGLDVEEWLRQDLVHLLIAGGGFIPFHMPIREFVEAASNSSCKVYGCFEALRPMLDEDAMCAIAARYWAAGVDGLYFFNYYSMSGEWKRDFLALLDNPARLARADKQYQVDSGISRPTTQLGFSFVNAIPKASLPARLSGTPGGRGLSLAIDIADDLEAAAATGSRGICTLGLSFEALPESCELAVALNREPIPWERRVRPPQPWTRARYDPDWNEFPSILASEPIEGEQIEFELETLPCDRDSTKWRSNSNRRSPSCCRMCACGSRYLDD